MTRAHVIAAALGATAALAVAWVGWNIVWTHAVDRAYGRRWREDS